MNRRCLAYDINPGCAERRVDIRVADAIEALRNLKKKKANLIFIDPPYFKKKEKEYGELSISDLSRNEYLDYFSKLARECIKKLAPDGRVALLMSDYTEEDPHESIFIHHYIERFEKEGFIVERIIQCPLSTQQLHPDFFLKFTESRKLGRLARNLVIFYASKLK
jgi:23S rRNA G2069 N7-methylase RlmK/C1962 C5-methylase RlmI